MGRTKIITGLDIGSSKVSAVTALISKDGRPGVLSHATQDSRGVSRGSIVDLNEAVRSVSAVLKKLKTSSPNGLGRIYVNITGENLRGSRSKGMIPLSVRGREVTRHDMARCVEAASIIHLPFDREIVHRIVQKFSVDDQPWIKDPMGLYASRLGCEVYIITAGVSSIQNILKCVTAAGYDAGEVVYTGIADGEAVLDKAELGAGVILLSMGASLTGISVFCEGALCDTEILQVGTEDFKDDGFRSSAAFNSVILRISSKIEDSKRSGTTARSVVITGGVIFVDGIIEYLEEKLSYPVKMGVAKDIRGEISGIDSVRLCTAMGLVKYAAAKYEALPKSAGNLVKTLSSAVADIFNNYF